MRSDGTSTSSETPSEGVDSAAEFETLQTLILALQRLPPEARSRVFLTAGTFLKLQPQGSVSAYGHRATETEPSVAPAFSEDTAMSPKEFLLEKQPRTDVERVACLAYYLAHYRDTPHFKTLDLSKVNTEAAQPKFSNATYAANNAIKTGYLVSSSKGQRQLSAAGEQFVRSLPDREAAKTAMRSASPGRRRGRRTKNSKKAK